jgi:hypothetical protein
MKAYKKQLNLFKNNLKDTAARYGAVYIEVSSSETVEKVILEKFIKRGIVVQGK